MVGIIRRYAKCTTAKIDQNISNLEEEKQRILSNKTWDEYKKGMEAAHIDERIKSLKRVKLEKIRDNNVARFFLEGEVL